jgi:hypothetical protein
MRGGRTLAPDRGWIPIRAYGPKQIPTSLVGGFLQLTTVTKREISTRFIHRWADEIGKRLVA